MRSTLVAVTAVVTSAATALALAVVTAPAAQAFQEPQASGFSGAAVDLTDIVRLVPQADGSQQAPTLQAGKTSQQVPGIQVRLPIKTEATASNAGKQYATWQPGDQLTVTLPAGVTFAATPRVTSSDLTDVSVSAATPGPTYQAELTADGGPPVTLKKPAVTVTLSADRSAARLLFTGSQWDGVGADALNAPWLNLETAALTDQDTNAAPAAGAQPGFLLTVDQLSLNISPSAAGTVTATVTGEASNGFYGSSDYATYPAQAPAACTVGAVGGTRLASFVGGATTLGFLPPLAASNKQATGQVVNATSELQQLPPVTISGRFTAGVAYQISADVVPSQASATSQSLGSVLFDFPSHNPAIDYMDAKITADGGLAAKTVTLAPSAGQYGTPRTAQLTVASSQGSTTSAGSVTIAGLRVAGYVPSGQLGAQALPEGTVLRISVAVPGGVSGGLAVNDAATVGCLTKAGASAYSAVQEPADTSGFVASTDLTIAAKAARTAGLNRYDTAARLAQQFASAATGQPKAIVIANGENRKGGFDALSANYLAGRVGAPILLTSADSLPDETALALRAILNGVSSPVTLYVMGKADSVSDAVVTRMTQIARQAVSGTVTAQRVAGNNRYATSAAAASIGTVGSLSFAKGSPQYKTAILTSGLVSADALAAGPLSFSLGVPVLLTGGGKLPAEVSAVIKKQGIKQVFVLGGTDRVTAGELAELRALGVVVVKRIAGKNRYATSADLYSFAAKSASTAASAGGGLGWVSGSTIYLANGTTGFPDALAVGPLAGTLRSALVTTGPAALDASVAAFAKAQGKPLTALGQPSTVPDKLL